MKSADCGKGANTVISYLHYFFENHGFGESYCYLQADNCSGQNKSNTMIRYLCWRVYKKLHNKISLGFMLAGHTKFAPDMMFLELLKNHIDQDLFHHSTILQKPLKNHLK